MASNVGSPTVGGVNAPTAPSEENYTAYTSMGLNSFPTVTYCPTGLYYGLFPLHFLYPRERGFSRSRVGNCHKQF